MICRPEEGEGTAGDGAVDFKERRCFLCRDLIEVGPWEWDPGPVGVAAFAVPLGLLTVGVQGPVGALLGVAASEAVSGPVLVGAGAMVEAFPSVRLTPHRVTGMDLPTVHPMAPLTA